MYDPEVLFGYGSFRTQRSQKRGGPPTWGLGAGLTTPFLKKKTSTLRNVTEDLELDSLERYKKREVHKEV